MNQEIRLTLSGMHCQGCAALIQDELLETPGVETARVSFSEKLAVVELDAGQAESNPVKSLLDRIEKLGYQAAIA